MPRRDLIESQGGKKIALLVMTLNERYGVEAILPKISKTQFSKILVVDGNSDDGTVEWLTDNHYEVMIQTNPGIRSGMVEALELLNSDIDWIFTISPDGNCDPSTIPNFVNRVQSSNARIVFGSRYFESGKSEDDDVITRLGNRLFNLLLNFLFKSEISDGMVIYRAFERSLIRELRLDDPRSYQFFEKIFRTRIGWEPLMSVRAAKYKIPFEDVYVGEPKRLHGERKLQIVRWGLAFFSQLLVERLTPKFKVRKLTDEGRY